MDLLCLRLWNRKKNHMKLHSLTAHELRDKIKNKEISSVEATTAALSRIEQVESKVDSFLSIFGEEAVLSARKVDKKIASGNPTGSLAGIPMAIKDNICTRGIPTTCASKMLKNFVPPYNAVAVEKLFSQDAILLGKLNMDEFAMGSSCENSAFKMTKNPYNLTKVPGGSSGGCAAAIASDEAFFTLGSDTGGSIREPASFCGCVGLKPTYGTVSRYGLIAFASSLDQIGPITKDVQDAAMILDVISGKDIKDATSVDVNANFEASLTGDIKGLKIGIPQEYFSVGIDAEVSSALYKAIDNMKALGAVSQDTSLALNPYSLPAYYIISSAEASSNLARFDGVKYGFRAEKFCDLAELYQKTRSQGFGAEVKRRIMFGTYVLSSGYYDEYYKKALKVRSMIMADFDEAFKKYDILITPAYPTTAFGIGEKINPVQMYMGDICSVSVNIGGLPAVVIPCGYDNNGLPIGIQIIGKPYSEATILNAAYALEKTITKRAPQLTEVAL